MTLPIDPNIATPTGIPDFDGFVLADLDELRWSGKIETGSTAISISSGSMKFFNNGSGTAGISYVPSKIRYGKIWRISADMRIASCSGSVGTINLVLYKDDGNYIKFGPYKGGGVNDNAYLQYIIESQAGTPASLAGTAIDTSNNHTYTMAVLNDVVMIYYDGEYKASLPFQELTNYEVWIEGGTSVNSDTIDARADDIEMINSFDPLSMTIGLMCDQMGELVCQIAPKVTSINTGINSLLSGATGGITTFDGQISLTNTNPVEVEFTTDSYGSVFILNSIFNLEGAGIDNFGVYDASIINMLSYTSEANNLITNSVPLVPPTGPVQVNDITVFQMYTPFKRLDIYMDGGVSNTDSTFTWNYWNGSSWQPLVVTDGTLYNGKVFGKSGSVTWSLDLPFASSCYSVGAIISSPGNSKPVATHIQASKTTATGFDSLAAFMSRLDVSIFRKVGGAYTAIPSESMPFIQCILDRNVDIQNLQCWSDTKIRFQLSATPNAPITINYSGFIDKRKN